METRTNPLESFTALIVGLGGPAAVAAAGGVPAGVARQWKKRDSVPPQYWLPLIDLAKEKPLEGVDEALLTRLASRVKAA